ncbi:hypothetical protein ACFV2H_49930 [Streptomyces sp. NPDC059629]|uniref:hypothetical protein n=1 Tax=Streptomyces sp. NPDC059629 TaxID=3346889 RepID=UPI0036A1D4E3
MITESAAAQWDLELDDLFLTIGHRFGRVELRRRMRDYARGLLAPVARKNSWVRHEAPCDRVEVRDLCRRAVAAAG